MGVKQSENSEPTIEINGLKFTYPGIDGHPPLGSTPLIEDFSLTLHASDRCLLVGSNGAGLLYLFLLSYSVFVNTSLCLVAQKVEEKKIKNWKLIF
jgi:ABC-type multidrug transport system fused ATPase/permease subunit